jgi:glycoside/pentoside/hexuronide:cation symporter, GPH family
MADSRTQARTERLPAGRFVAHSLIEVPIAGAQLPLGSYVPAIYAQHFGMSLYALGLMFLGERIRGTLSDPLTSSLRSP